MKKVRIWTTALGLVAVLYQLVLTWGSYDPSKSALATVLVVAAMYLVGELADLTLRARSAESKHDAAACKSGDNEEP